MKELEYLDQDSHRLPPNENERAMVMLLTSCFLRHFEESCSGSPFTLPGLESVVPHFWLTQARAVLVLVAKEHKQSPGGGREAADLARRWIHNALRESWVADNLVAAAKILIEIAEVELIEQEEEDLEARAEMKGLLAEASDYLTNAAKLSPARPDILAELAKAHFAAASLADSDKDTLMAEAVRRSDEALACFTQANRWGEATGVFHPVYALCLFQSGVFRWQMASASEDEVEKRELLVEACRLLRQSVVEGGMTEPTPIMMLGEAALTLAWLPGDSRTRRNLFSDACEQFAAVIARDPKDYRACMCRASAVVGLTALSHGDEMRSLSGQAEEAFAEMVRLLPGESEPFLDACDNWLRLASETDLDIAIEGARRAVDAARKANLVTPGSGDYYLACGLSRLGQTAEAAESLAAALARDPSRVSDSLRDPHLAAVWDSRSDWRRELAQSGAG
jgi:tetratricopeptide (TPR) repeat protein